MAKSLETADDAGLLDVRKIPRGGQARHICVVGLRGIPDVIGGIEAPLPATLSARGEALAGHASPVLIRNGYTSATCRNMKASGPDHLVTAYLGVDTVVHSFLSMLYARLFLRPDVLHFHGIGPGFFTPLARLLGMRTVVTHHARDYLRPKWTRRGQTFLRLGERFSAHSANRIICVSKALYQEFVDAFPIARSRARIIPNASALASQAPDDIEPVLTRLGLVANGYILAVGRLDAAKSFNDLIAAFNRPARIASL